MLIVGGFLWGAGVGVGEVERGVLRRGDCEERWGGLLLGVFGVVVEPFCIYDGMRRMAAK